MKNSRKKRPKRIALKEEFVELLGDYKDALKFQQFFYWSERTRSHYEYLHEELENTKTKCYGWFYKSAQEFAKECMMPQAKNSVRDFFNKMVAIGYIDKRDSTNPRRNEKEYRLNLKKLIVDINSLGYDLYSTIKDSTENYIIYEDSQYEEKIIKAQFADSEPAYYHKPKNRVETYSISHMDKAIVTSDNNPESKSHLSIVQDKEAGLSEKTIDQNGQGNVADNNTPKQLNSLSQNGTDKLYVEPKQSPLRRKQSSLDQGGQTLTETTRNYKLYKSPHESAVNQNRFDDFGGQKINQNNLSQNNQANLQATAGNLALSIEYQHQPTKQPDKNSQRLDELLKYWQSKTGRSANIRQAKLNSMVNYVHRLDINLLKKAIDQVVILQKTAEINYSFEAIFFNHRLCLKLASKKNESLSKPVVSKENQQYNYKKQSNFKDKNYRSTQFSSLKYKNTAKKINDLEFANLIKKQQEFLSQKKGVGVIRC